MPHYADKKVMPFTPEQMFDLVSDVGSYPEFLPWCMGARLYDKRENGFKADLIIGFKAFKERFTSKVTLERPGSVRVDYIRGPMKQLYNHWHFEACEGGCMVDFEVDFEFKNIVIEKLIGPMFADSTERMIAAFEARATFLYGAR